jgi:hypothetical protein
VNLELPPFCPGEWLERPAGLTPLDGLFEPDFKLTDWPDETSDWPDWLLCGGFAPAVTAASEESRNFWFAGYVQTYLERDLRQLRSRFRMSLASRRSSKAWEPISGCSVAQSCTVDQRVHWGKICMPCPGVGYCQGGDGHFNLVEMMRA